MSEDKYKLSTASDGRMMLEHHEYPRYIILFPKGNFNNMATQEVKEVDEFPKKDFMAIARIMREAGEWLQLNHSNIL